MDQIPKLDFETLDTMCNATKWDGPRSADSYLKFREMVFTMQCVVFYEG